MLMAVAIMVGSFFMAFSVMFAATTWAEVEREKLRGRIK